MANAAIAPNPITELSATTPLPAAHKRRLRSVVKRLVIELAHLETVIQQGTEAAPVFNAAVSLDEAIDGLNAYLSPIQAPPN
jgi:hypothetical protein